MNPEIDRRLIRLSVVVTALLILVNLVFVLFPNELHRTRNLEEPVRTLVRQLDLAREESIATWCTSALLLLNAVFAYTLRRRLLASDPAAARYLGVFSLGFSLLSVDDVAQLHEKVENLLESGLEAHQLSDDYLGLAFGSTLAFLLAVLAYRSLARHLRRSDVAFLAASILCVAMAVFAEGLEAYLDCSRRSPCARLEVVFEEGGELLAIVFFLTLQYRVLSHLREKGPVNPPTPLP